MIGWVRRQRQPWEVEPDDWRYFAWWVLGTLLIGVPLAVAFRWLLGQALDQVFADRSVAPFDRESLITTLQLPGIVGWAMW